MDSFLPIDISATALSTQRLRLALIAGNLANVNTTQTPEGGPYRRQELLVSAAPMEEFQSALERQITDGVARDEIGPSVSLAGHFRGVKPVGVVTDTREPILVQAPWHPEADANGNVLMPNISVMEEMVNMIAASRAYEANLTVMKTTRSMIMQALDMLK